MGRGGAIAFAAAAAVALAGAAFASASGAGAGAGYGPGAAASADCVLVQHSKTVIRKVRVGKGAKARKVKRKRKVRWTTCEPVPASPATPPPAACAEPSSVLGVTARDDNFLPRYSLSRPCVTAGTVRIQLGNRGEDPHQLWMRPLGQAGEAPVHTLPHDPPPYELPLTELEAWDGVTEPAPSVEADVSLPAGDWYLWCEIGDHEAAGMNATLQVR